MWDDSILGSTLDDTPYVDERDPSFLKPEYWPPCCPITCPDPDGGIVPGDLPLVEGCRDA